MRNTLRGFLLTALGWFLLIGAYSAIELVQGRIPFGLLQWNVGGKFITIVIVMVLALGTAIGYASDRIQARQGRR